MNKTEKKAGFQIMYLFKKIKWIDKITTLFCMLTRFPKPIRDTIFGTIKKWLLQQCKDRSFNPNPRSLPLVHLTSQWECICAPVEFLSKESLRTAIRMSLKDDNVKIIKQPSFVLQIFYIRNLYHWVSAPTTVFFWIQDNYKYMEYFPACFLGPNPVQQHVQYTGWELKFPFSHRIVKGVLPMTKKKSYTTLIIINYICSYPPHSS